MQPRISIGISGSLLARCAATTSTNSKLAVQSTMGLDSRPLQHLGDPLKEFNAAFAKLQSRCGYPPLLGTRYSNIGLRTSGDPTPTVPPSSVSVPQVSEDIAHAPSAVAAAGDTSPAGPPVEEGELGHPDCELLYESSDSSSAEASDVDSTETESSGQEDEEEDLVSPTCFSLDTAEDVSLDMDGDIDY